MRVMLVGAEAAAIQVLKRLAETEHDVVAVLADETPAAAGAGLGEHARRLGLPVLDAALVRTPDLAGWMTDQGVDLLLNVHSLSIVHGDVVLAPRIGSFNLHPGPLPRYAGLNTVSWAIYNGEQTHGVTLHWMDAGVDTGAVAYRADFPITDHDSGLSVFTKCVRHGVPLVFQLIEVAGRDPGAIPAERQEGERTLYRRRDIPQQGRIEWGRTARRVHDFVRASDFSPFASPWPQPSARLGDRELGIVRTALTGRPCTEAPGTIGEVRGDAATVATGDEWLELVVVAADGLRRPANEILTAGQVLEDGT
jgi:UDP-4-amino-4-deoxy-L-arabinose formyltransferase/UDP-glucuronic acid dehydrogenase (UDP-4-keto-hexauronic acid decarboxylating)